MNLQYISDSTGQTTGVFIPINEWNNLKSKIKDIEKIDIDIPEWHKNIVKKRINDFKKNTDIAIDFAIDEIEKEL